MASLLHRAAIIKEESLETVDLIEVLSQKELTTQTISLGLCCLEMFETIHPVMARSLNRT